MNLSLVEPATKYEKSLKAYKAEVIQAGEPGTPFILNFDMDNFPAFVTLLNGWAAGENLEKGFVAHSTFLLVENDTEVVGISNIRHELTPKLLIEGGHIGYGVRPTRRKKGFATLLLKESLQEARALGIERALLTCDKGNIASAKTITNNGGSFDSERFVEQRNCIVQRYWMQL